MSESTRGSVHLTYLNLGCRLKDKEIQNLAGHLNRLVSVGQLGEEDLRLCKTVTEARTTLSNLALDMRRNEVNCNVVVRSRDNLSQRFELTATGLPRKDVRYRHDESSAARSCRRRV